MARLPAGPAGFGAAATTGSRTSACGDRAGRACTPVPRTDGDPVVELGRFGHAEKAAAPAAKRPVLSRKRRLSDK
ncbi:hypothetical protein GCM10010439_54200 [Actinocorallia aurantiaca]|uniref:Uncharacterized protein n=1 Tax=Actinocorallia aurantiaca TaxID=46204 RepID=A0ABN3UIS3_9ACTN